MNTKSYTTIFILLSTCILCILILQGFWIRNLYIQKSEEFSRTVYESLGQVADKLNERENIHFIKNSLKWDSINIIDRGIGKRDMRLIKRTPGIKIINKVTSTSARNGKLIISDSIVNVSRHGKTIIVGKYTNENEPEQGEIDELMGRMMVEIQGLNVSKTDSIRADTLAGIIRRQLAYKGVFTPFEFSLNKWMRGKELILARSPGFSGNQPSYKGDLSAKHVFSTPYFLFLQFPSQTMAVFSSMKRALLLSGFFSVLILTIFYFTLRAILRQKKLGEMKNDFINNMTHELKTPIATISLAIDAINNPVVKSDEAKLNEYTRILKEENSKLNRQVERVLEIAQLDKGDLHLNKAPVDLPAILKSVAASFDLQLKSRQGILTLDAPANAVTYGDRQHLETVFANLLDNAIKYSHEKCKIEIHVVQTGNLIKIHILDNGIGIDKSIQEKVFEKFYRAQGGDLHDVKGFGLGLSYVKSIVQAHGGSIELKSEKNKGSEFIITLSAYAG